MFLSAELSGYKGKRGGRRGEEERQRRRGKKGTGRGVEEDAERGGREIDEVEGHARSGTEVEVEKEM